MSTPKFKVNDQVNKKRNTGILLKIESNVGTVTKVIEKHNKRDRICYYYEVKWPDRRRSEHAQHILVPIEKKSPENLAPADFSLSETDKTAYYGS